MGKGGQAIEILKFQTVKHGRYGIMYIDPVGAFIRRVSFDELPKLFNVLTRDIDLIGPYPVSQEFAEFYQLDLTEYMKHRPGLVSPGFVAGLRGFEAFEYDLAYARTRTFASDLMVLVRVMPASMQSPDEDDLNL